MKKEIYRVAERHAAKGVALKVFVANNSPIAGPRDIFVGAPCGVMAGLVPAIHVFPIGLAEGVDARDKRGHDGH